MDRSWLDTLAAVAPTVATAIGGPLGGLAVSVVADALGVERTEAAVGGAVAASSPEMFGALKQAEADLTARLEELGVDRERIAAQDRANARDREVKTGDHTPRWLAFALLVGFFAVLGGLLLYGVPQRGGDALLVLVGALSGAFSSVVGYYFGSSSSSVRKTELMGVKQ